MVVGHTIPHLRKTATHHALRRVEGMRRKAVVAIEENSSSGSNSSCFRMGRASSRNSTGHGKGYGKQ